jgi:hypothetical protein
LRQAYDYWQDQPGDYDIVTFLTPQMSEEEQLSKQSSQRQTTILKEAFKCASVEKKQNEQLVITGMFTKHFINRSYLRKGATNKSP